MRTISDLAGFLIWQFEDPLVQRMSPFIPLPSIGTALLDELAEVLDLSARVRLLSSRSIRGRAFHDPASLPLYDLTVPTPVSPVSAISRFPSHRLFRLPVAVSL